MSADEGFADFAPAATEDASFFQITPATLNSVSRDRVEFSVIDAAPAFVSRYSEVVEMENESRMTMMIMMMVMEHALDYVDGSCTIV